MTYEVTYYFYNNVDEKPREIVTLVQCETHSWVYHFCYDDFWRKPTNEDTSRTFNQDQTFNAHVLFDNIVAQAKHTYKYSSMSCSTSYEYVENF